MSKSTRYAILILCLVVGWSDVFSRSSEGQNSSPLPVKKSSGLVAITGDNLQINSKEKIATYSGNVKVVQGETTMFSDLLVIHLDATGRKLQQAIATGNVRIVDTKITATGDKGILYNEEQKLELTGHAKVWQDNNTVTAHRILVYLADQILEGYTEGASEKASMTIYSTGEFITPFDSQEPQTEKTPQHGADSKKESASPIVIVSDTLRLDNPAQQATFSGNVVATKEETTLNADKMSVYITQNEKGESDVDKIEVIGHVKIINKTTIVTGVKGIFLNQEQFAKVEGDERRKARVDDKTQNLVLEAPVIEIDLKTNTLGAKGGTSSTTVSDGGTQPSGSQRIRTEFGSGEGTPLFGGEQETPTPQPGPTPKPETRKDIDRSNFPSVTLYPGKEGA